MTTSDPLAEPQTEAGRALLALDVFDTASMDDEDFRRVILRIEAQSRQQARAAFAAQVAALRDGVGWIVSERDEQDRPQKWDPAVRMRNAVLALLAASPEPASPGSERNK